MSVQVFAAAPDNHFRGRESEANETSGSPRELPLVRIDASLLLSHSNETAEAGYNPAG